MEINDVLGHLAELNVETQEQLFQLNLAKAQVEAIGVLVGALGHIETKLEKINHQLEVINRYGLDFKQK